MAQIEYRQLQLSVAWDRSYWLEVDFHERIKVNVLYVSEFTEKIKRFKGTPNQANILCDKMDSDNLMVTPNLQKPHK